MLERCWFLWRILAAFGLMVLAAIPALACDQASYTHNGSVMTVYACDGRMVIDYERPKPGLAKLGVRPGTVLFRGTYSELSGGLRINGRAHVFRRGCRPGGYEVNGWMMDDERAFALEGTAPVRGANCRARRYRQDVLTFKARN